MQMAALRCVVGPPKANETGQRAIEIGPAVEPKPFTVLLVLPVLVACMYHNHVSCPSMCTSDTFSVQPSLREKPVYTLGCSC